MIELRPGWCHQGDGVPAGLTVQPWRISPDGIPLDSDLALDRWEPSATIEIERAVEVDPDALRSTLGLPMSARFDVAASWYCSSTSLAGTARNGPALAVDGAGELILRVTLDGAVAGTVDLETCLLLRDDGRGGPSGRLVWSDNWETAADGRSRSVILEGDMMRLAIVPVSFDGYLRPEARHALWHIDIDPDAQPEHPFTASVTIQVNADVLDADHGGDLSALSDDVVGAMRVDLLRAVAYRFLPEWEEPDPEVGSLGAVLVELALATAGGWQNARRTIEDRPTEFDAAVRSMFTGSER